MPSIAFLDNLARDSASIGRVRQALEDNEVVCFITNRPHAKWIYREVRCEGAVHHSFLCDGDWPDFIVKLDEIDVPDLETALTDAYDAWKMAGAPDNHVVRL